MSLRGGLVGCGYFAANHLNAWCEIDGAEIVALCDSEHDKAQRYAQQFGISAVHGSVQQMLAEQRLDFVDVVTQPHTHAELVNAIAAAGVNVICQKPLAPTLADIESMVATAAKHDVAFMVHENFRWQTPMRRLKAAVTDIGEPFFIRVSFRSGFDIYKGQPYLATDERFILYDLGVHLFDLARFFLGDIASLSCHTYRVNPAIKGEDAATALLKSSAGAHAVVDMSYASKLAQELFPQTLVHIEGRHGSATLGADYQLTVTTSAGTRTVDAAPNMPFWGVAPHGAVQESVRAIQQHWVDCLQSGRSPETTGEDNLATMRLVFAAYESAASERMIALSG